MRNDARRFIILSEIAITKARQGGWIDVGWFYINFWPPRGTLQPSARKWSIIIITYVKYTPDIGAWCGRGRYH